MAFEEEALVPHFPTLFPEAKPIPTPTPTPNADMNMLFCSIAIYMISIPCCCFLFLCSLNVNLQNRTIRLKSEGSRMKNWRIPNPVHDSPRSWWCYVQCMEQETERKWKIACICLWWRCDAEDCFSLNKWVPAFSGAAFTLLEKFKKGRRTGDSYTCILTCHSFNGLFIGLAVFFPSKIQHMD